MMTTPPPPRHLPHGAPAVPGGLLAGRRAARIRAIANSSQLPQERALADSMVMTAWLTAAQRARYAVSLRAGLQVEDFMERLADERRVVLEEGADPVEDELASAAEAERAARQLPLRVLEGALLLLALVLAVTLVVLGLRADGLSRSSLPPSAGPFLIGVAVLVILAAVVGTVASRRRDRSLLGWAVDRPGQLGRGLPMRRPLQGGSAGPAILSSLGPAVLVGLGIIAICVGAAVLLITLLSPDAATMTTAALWSLGGGVLALLLAVLAVQLRGRRLEQIVRRERAAEWFGDLRPTREADVDADEA
ncbi:MAG: hypothetical protein L0G94_00255 [Brachybacterium sp.]|uniref:hypothetical protein n=1 Tax=Brachybacterium sp. TaxID=1891286 RepID=UPI0026485564|nr:hypothetical protein [Brachybacterium sp.]MDN5685103.1 hypothetical protein [Brachybacterium sp.]